MPPLSVMFKTVSSDCNLDCSYCYYRQSMEGERPRRRIDPGMLERFLPQYMEYVADSHQANLSGREENRPWPGWTSSGK